MEEEKEITTQEFIFTRSEREVLEYADEATKQNYKNKQWLEKELDFKIDKKFYENMTKKTIANIVFFGKYADSCKHRRKARKAQCFYVRWATIRIINKLPLLRQKIFWHVVYFFVGNIQLAMLYIFCPKKYLSKEELYS